MRTETGGKRKVGSLFSRGGIGRLEEEKDGPVAAVWWLPMDQDPFVRG